MGALRDFISPDGDKVSPKAIGVLAFFVVAVIFVGFQAWRVMGGGESAQDPRKTPEALAAQRVQDENMKQLPPTPQPVGTASNAPTEVSLPRAGMPQQGGN